MVNLIRVPAMSAALKRTEEIVAKNRDEWRKTIVFCGDGLSFELKKRIAKIYGGGLFDPFVYTFPGFMNSFSKRGKEILGRRGSVAAVRRILEDNAESLLCFTPETAEDVYDFVSIFRTSRMDADGLGEIAGKVGDSPLLARKLRDVSFVSEKYSEYLAKSDLLDMTEYFDTLPLVMEESGKIGPDSDVVFAGFRSFSPAETEALSHCMRHAGNTYGVLVGGDCKVYTNEAVNAFEAAAAGLDVSRDLSSRLSLPEAETVRTRIFDVGTFKKIPKMSDGGTVGNVHIFEARDEEEELEYVAAKIKQIVSSDDGVKYSDISVMMQDVESERSAVSRVFSRYRIPYYIDGCLPFSESPIASFLVNLLLCDADGYYPENVDAVASNPLFDLSAKVASECRKGKEGMQYGIFTEYVGGERTGLDFPSAEDIKKLGRRCRDEFRNYAGRVANFRGGIERDFDGKLCRNQGFDPGLVLFVMKELKSCVRAVSEVQTVEGYCKNIKSLLLRVKAEDKLNAVADRFKCDRRQEATLYKASYYECLDILGDVEGLYRGEKMSTGDFANLLKARFDADRVSVSRPAINNVLIGNVSEDVNIGSEVLFVLGMTSDVPRTKDDVALFSESELEEIERLYGKSARNGGACRIFPKLTDTNRWYAENVGLNLCSFGRELYMSYPLRKGGKDESVSSDVISYVRKMFAQEGRIVKTLTMNEIRNSDPEFTAYHCTDRAVAVRTLLNGDDNVRGSVERFLRDVGRDGDIETARIQKHQKELKNGGREIFLSDGAVYPTDLEAWFSCPYKAFLEKGLGLKDNRKSGAAQDVGLFVHGALNFLFDPAKRKIDEFKDSAEVAETAKTFCESLIENPPYSSMRSRSSTSYFAKSLVTETVGICVGVYEELKNSCFEVEDVESTKYGLTLDDGTILRGRIDRVDKGCAEENSSMIRVIDYKTGYISDDVNDYYMGKKLQLELYLKAASCDSRTPVGAFYFPAAVSFKSEKEADVNPFALHGVMNGSESYRKLCDRTHAADDKDSYLDKKVSSVGNGDAGSSDEDFENFLEYGRLVVEQAVREISDGFISPSPVLKTCGYCTYFGLCGNAEKSDYSGRDKNGFKCKNTESILGIVRGTDDVRDDDESTQNEDEE